MKVVLRQDYEKLGKTGDIKDVSAGFFRNLLLPRGVAYPAEKKYLKVFEEEKKLKAIRDEKKKKESTDQAAKLSKIQVTIKAKSGAEEKLFGSVTAGHIAEELKKEGFTVDKKQVMLDEDIKALGVYTITVKLHQDISAQVKVWVVKED